MNKILKLMLVGLMSSSSIACASGWTVKTDTSGNAAVFSPEAEGVYNGVYFYMNAQATLFVRIAGVSCQEMNKNETQKVEFGNVSYNEQQVRVKVLCAGDDIAMMPVTNKGKNFILNQLETTPEVHIITPKGREAIITSKGYTEALEQLNSGDSHKATAI
ncbi:hypothetical protein [Vibrio superstes]|uniref:Lipoprotein n=1 Tax=Vibrio superstes NBRC 103154 TaxID=1219062 RepID=A0A511QM91_9VIBR|nr:hypothetical protein [Vibrio superstes]GEM78096.1 hypothetical protein VSU01S_03410 [Vibrio superstes NBRC 103154]